MELEILHFIQGLHVQWLTPVMIFLSAIGEVGICWIIISIILVFFPKTRQCGLAMMASMALSFLLGNVVLKNIIARPRPFYADESVQLLIPIPSEYSFPSGHTLNGFTAAFTIFLYFRKPGVLAFILAGMIAFSRLYFFVHYPTDIIAGIVLGLLDAWVVVYLFKKYKRKDGKLH